MADNSVDHVWAMSKHGEGWYVAKCSWDEKYAKHLEELGYQVKKSFEKPR